MFSNYQPKNEHKKVLREYPMIIILPNDPSNPNNSRYELAIKPAYRISLDDTVMILGDGELVRVVNSESFRDEGEK